MPENEFDEPANVLWHARIPPPGTTDAGEVAHFDNLADAIRFVMEEIPEAQRFSAWITKDSGSLSIEEITALYPQIPPSAD